MTVEFVSLRIEQGRATLTHHGKDYTRYPLLLA